MPGNIARAVEGLASHLQQFVVPVFRPEAAGPAEQFGTGFFVTAEQNTFFVSAAHVLDELEHSQTGLCVYSDPGQLRRLGGRLLRTPLPRSGNRRDDRLDVGVLRMSGEGLPPLPAMGKLPVPLSILRPEQPPRHGEPYLLIGFPVSKVKINREDKSLISAYWPVISISIALEQYEPNQLDPNAHIAMTWKKRNILDAKLKRISPVGLRGMSGSPLFKILGDGRFEVVGIFIEHRKQSSLLVAATAAIAIDMISQLIEYQCSQ